MEEPAAEPPECPLLDKLPPELRNNIYEMLFAPTDIKNKENQIDLCAANPPSKDIVLTCRQIYNEANKMYKATYRNYWSTTDFVIDDRVAIVNQTAIEKLREDDLRHVKSLGIHIATEDNQPGLALSYRLLNLEGCSESRLTYEEGASEDLKKRQSYFRFKYNPLDTDCVDEDKDVSSTDKDRFEALCEEKKPEREMRIMHQIRWLALYGYTDQDD